MFGFSFSSNSNRVYVSNADKIAECKKSIDRFVANSFDSSKIKCRGDELEPRNRIAGNARKLVEKMSDPDITQEKFDRLYNEVNKIGHGSTTVLPIFGYGVNTHNPLYRDVNKEPYTDNSWKGMFERLFRPEWVYECDDLNDSIYSEDSEVYGASIAPAPEPTEVATDVVAFNTHNTLHEVLNNAGIEVNPPLNNAGVAHFPTGMLLDCDAG